jgi:predicted ester cyclase
MGSPLREAAEATVVRMVEELWNRRDLKVADELFPAGFDNGPGRGPGPEFVKEWHRSTAESFPDLRYEIDQLVAGDDGNVAFRWTATGTQLGQFGPIPPTGRTATYQGAHFVFVAEGRITRLWSINGTFAKVQQLGATVVPPRDEGDSDAGPT